MEELWLAGAKLFFGALMLLVGAEAIVRAGVALAYRVGLSPLWIGLTVVAVGTSAPEIAVSVDAALNNTGAIAYGNVIGSNILNVCLVLGLIAIVHPVAVNRMARIQDIPILIVLGIVAWFFAANQTVSRVEGIGLLLFTVAYILWSARREKQTAEEHEATPAPALSKRPLAVQIAILVGGLVVLALGGGWVLDGAVAFAEAAGIPTRVVAIAVVAVGTSLPELAVGLAGAWRREVDLVIGNIVGSNLLNLGLVLGLASTVRPLLLPPGLAADSIIMITVSMLLLGFAWHRRTILRVEGLVLVGCYATYMWWLISTAT